ncbi:MAG: hypothetical protein H7174_14235 [Flavobacterium sp.]|nr:hypothetical protein [Flavobacterium sp.]
MKKITLLFVLTINSICFSQVQFPNIATSNGNAERISSFGVDDVSNNFLEILNSTVDANKFIPTIWAHQEADNRFVLRHFATTNSTRDNGTTPIMIFRAELRNSLNLTAPNEVPFPWGTSAANVVNRPLFAWENGNTQLMRIAANGNITIGTSLTPTAYKLAVGGKIIAEELKVQLQAQWPDYVFKKNYKLPTLAEVEKQIQDKGHLSNIPSAIEIEKNGFEVGEMVRIQQEKIEELTLYIIELNNKLELQNDKIKSLILKK